MINDFSSSYGKNHEKRYRKTLDFLKQNLPPPQKILDLGPKNPFTEILTLNGYDVQNTPKGLDLDFNFKIVENREFEAVTAFEIFEHMVSPFPLLCGIAAKKLIASVPLRLWFKSAYWNPTDPFDRHYHEFEPRQFDMLLEKSGWKIIATEKWIDKTNKIGFRPFLRNITPRYYIVFCERV